MNLLIMQYFSFTLFILLLLINCIFYTVSVSVQNFLQSCIKWKVRKLNYSVSYVFLHQYTLAHNRKTNSKNLQCGLL